MDAIRALLESLIDYAGLFPPSALPMAAAAANYARYRDSGEAWILSRFVVPVARLDEFESAVGNREHGWSLAAIAGKNLAEDLARLERFNQEHRGRFVVDAIEIKGVPETLPKGLTSYLEVDAGRIEAVKAIDARAKIRTGGLTPDVFPRASQIARFVETCANLKVAFKATAGLHHPLRCYRPLTYESGGPSGWMYGFVNLFLGAALVRNGMSAADFEELLVEESGAGFTFSEDSIQWRGHRASASEIAAARRDFAVSFGSCSFEEPIEDLKTLNIL